LKGISKVNGAQLLGNYHLLLLEPCGVPLAITVAKHGPLPLSKVEHIHQSLVRTLSQIHDLGIIHRDLHPGNIILVGGDLEPVLIDFGFATTRPNKHKEIVGLQDFLPLEVLLGLQSQTEETDFESLEMCMYYALHGSLPWQGKSDVESYLLRAAFNTSWKTRAN
jgi:eukaryotic-like serine/threonine-protein kinase